MTDLEGKDKKKDNKRTSSVLSPESSEPQDKKQDNKNSPIKIDIAEQIIKMPGNQEDSEVKT